MLVSKGTDKDTLKAQGKETRSERNRKRAHRDNTQPKSRGSLAIEPDDMVMKSIIKGRLRPHTVVDK